MHLWIQVCLLWWILLPTSTVQGQVLLEDLHRSALKNHPTLRALSHSQQAHEYAAAQHSYPDQPTLQLMGLGTSAQYLSVMQKVHVWGRYHGSYRAHLHKKNHMEALREDAKRRIIHNITVLYSSLFALQKKIVISEEYQGFMQRLVDVHSRGFAAARFDETAWVMAQQEKIRVRLEILELDRQMERAQQSLKSWVGEDLPQLTFQRRNLEEPQLLGHKIETLLADVAAGSARKDSAILTSEVHELRYLQAQADLGGWLYSTQFHIQAQQRISGPPQSPPWNVSVGVTLPLWPGKYSAEQHALQHRSLAQEQSIAAQADALANQIRGQIFSAQSYAQSLREYRQSLLPLLEHHVSSVEAAYRAQKKSLSELIASKKKLYRARHQYCSDFVRLTQSASEIQMLTGRKIADFFQKKEKGAEHNEK